MGLPGASLGLHILDFPGAWLTPSLRPEGNDWEECLSWLEESPILLIPIEATLIMEAMETFEESQRTSRELALAQIEDMARVWAKARNSKGEDGLVIFAPVKCENYFTTNGGSRNQGDELFTKSMATNTYGGILEVITEEVQSGKSKIAAEYHPIGTLGCVDFTGGKWDEKGHFHAKYRKRPDAKWSPYGADGVLISIAKFIAGEEKNKSRGFFTELGRWLTGVGKELDEAIRELATKANPPHMRKLNLP
jgi:hypothetical protein